MAVILVHPVELQTSNTGDLWGHMIANSRDAFQTSNLNRTPTRSRIGDEDWHVWPVTIPRRSITGRLIWGLVMRRRDGRKWIYKKYTEPKN